MVVLNYSGEEINAKIVYYGPGVSGKTTNLEYIHEKMPVHSKGKLVSMKTRTDRTLFFDFLPLELGEINGYRSRFLLYTVPGQVYYNATRKLVLNGVDGVVFVADSSRAKLAENVESLRNLEDNLNEHGLSLDTIPWVIQYNKRDVPDAMPVAELHDQLNLLGVPAYEAVATEGVGVHDTFQGVAGLLFEELKRKLERGDVARESGPAEASQVEADPVSDAVDSALREVDGAVTPPTAAPPPPHAPAAPPVQDHVAQAAGSPPGANAPGQPSASAQEHQAHPPDPAPVVDRGVSPTAPVPEPGIDPSFSFEAIPDSDPDVHSTARIEEAAVASEVARTQAPPDFVIDPLGGGKSSEEPVAPPDWMSDTHAASIDVRSQAGPAPENRPEPVSSPPTATVPEAAGAPAPRMAAPQETPAPQPAAMPAPPAPAPQTRAPEVNAPAAAAPQADPRPVPAAPVAPTPVPPAVAAPVVIAVPVTIPRSRLQGAERFTVRVDIQLTDD